jgi:pimeloyl-ACP methyl ester carboxylesterase
MNSPASVTGMDKKRVSRASPPSGKVISKDGTPIAYDRVGRGPPVILVDGALCMRSFGPMRKLAAELARDFAVTTYDRRGRGESGDAATAYTVDREVEDVAALIDAAGGSACVFGISSGAVLALAAAARGVAIEKIALYEAPLIVDHSRATTEEDWARIDAAVVAGRLDEAAKAFLKSVGLPKVAVAMMRWLPIWRNVRAVARTLPHDGALVRELQRGEPLPAGRWSSVAIPALALDGGKSPAWMRSGMRALAGALPNAEYRTLAGQAHDVAAKAVAPVLKEFFAGARATAH